MDPLVDSNDYYCSKGSNIDPAVAGDTDAAAVDAAVDAAAAAAAAVDEIVDETRQVSWLRRVEVQTKWLLRLMVVLKFVVVAFGVFQLIFYIDRTCDWSPVRVRLRNIRQGVVR